jgi:signal transduction histidine kinase/ActR/RegA family two-component response regulator
MPDPSTASTGDLSRPVGVPAALVPHLDFLGDWGVFETDVNLKVTVWNRWLVQRSGIQPSSTIGRPLLEVFPDLTSRGIDRVYRQVLDGKPVVRSQPLHAYLLPMSPAPVAGRTTYMQQSVRIVPLMEGDAICGTLTLIEDVTERVVYETELRARALRQTAVAAVAKAALAGTEVDDVAREMVELLAETLDADLVEILERIPENGTWARLAGKGWAKPVLAIFDAADVPRSALVVTSGVIEAEDIANDSRFEHDAGLHANGVRGSLLNRVAGRLDLQFGLIGVYSRTPRRFSTDEIAFIGSLADVLGITVERKRLEAELRVRVAELAEADQRKDEFLAMLAHELRNPLAPVRNGLLIMRLVGDNPQVQSQTREMIDRQVQHLSRLVDDLLDVSRITRGKVELRTEPVDLADIVNRAIETVRPLIEAKRHRLNVTHHRGPVRVMADATRLTQVLGNLLNNAAKYTDQGGEISLSLLLEGTSAVVRVVDTGIGITQRMLPKVFDLFTQIDGSLDRSQGGLGIGLTLVKTLVELHDGSVEAFSEGLGKGSTFVVRLPTLLGSDIAPNAKRTNDIATRPFRILVVDDNVDSAESLATVLRLSGHEVRTAHTGIQGLEAAREINPEVVLLDIGLPMMDGYEVARSIRADDYCRDALVIAMTGYGSDEDRRRSKEAGFDHHLVKPLDPNVVKRLLAEQAASRL